MRPDRLILELTETVLLADLPTVAVEMERLRSLGIRMAIGARAGGIARLVTLPVFSMVLAGALAGLLA